MGYKYFAKKSYRSGIKNENMSDQPLAKILHKPVVGKLRKRNVHSSYYIQYTIFVAQI